MCGSSDDDWVCDECLARFSLHLHKPGEFEFCAECQETIRHRCFCCDSQFEVPLNGDICEPCKEKMGGD
jgi:hypothetical protein